MTNPDNVGGHIKELEGLLDYSRAMSSHHRPSHDPKVRALIYALELCRAAPAGGCDCGSAATSDPDQTRHSADCATYGAPAGGDDLYRQACESVEEWKARALEAEADLARIHAQINAENGPTFMGEPVVGLVPKALDETINGVVSDLEMIAAGRDLVTGDPVSALQSQRIAKSALGRLLAAWNACDSAPAIEAIARNCDVSTNASEESTLRTAAALLRKLQQGAE